MKRRILLYSISIILIFILLGCGSDNQNLQTTSADALYTVKGIITDTTINGAPVRKADGSVVSFTDFEDFIAVIGWYNPSGVFVEIPSTRSEINASGEFTIEYNVIPLKTKNLVVKVVNIEGTQSYESILPVLDNGTNYVETLTPISSKKVQVIKTLANIGLDETLSVGEVISVLRPSYIAQLNTDDIATLTKAISGFYKNELDALSSTSISEADYEKIKAYGFTLSKNIIDDIQTGKYLKEDNIWRVYRHRLKAYAMKYLREKYESGSASSSPSRRAPALSASDVFSEVDMIFHATDANLVKLQTDAADGNIEVIDFETGSITSVPLSGTDTVSSVMDSIIADQAIYSKVDFVVSECIKMSNRVAAAASLFGQSIDFTTVEKDIDNFLVDYQNIDFASVSDAQNYIDVTGFTIKNKVAAKLSELMWAEAGSSVTGIRELNTMTPTVMIGVITDLTLALDPTSASYDSRLANIYSYSTNSGASNYNPLIYALNDRDDFLQNTTMSFTDSLDETLYMQDFIATKFVSNINTYLSSTSFSWNASEVLAMANIMTNVVFLQIDRPIEVMDYEGIYYEISGILKKYAKRLKVGADFYDYYLTDTLTGATLAYVNLYTDNQETTVWNMFATNPLYSTVANVEYDDGTGTLIADTTTNFANLLGNAVWYFKYYENFDTVYAYNALTSLDTVLNTHYRFKGFLLPPEGAFNNTTLTDITKYSTEPFKFDIADYETETFDIGAYVGETVDEVFGEIYWDSSNSRYLVINSTYTTGDNLVCPTQSPTGTYNYYEYWQLDFSNAVTTDESTGAFIAWDPADYTLTDKVWRFWGRLEDRVLNGTTITKTLKASKIEEEETANPAAGFYVTGVVTSVSERTKNNWVVAISDVNSIGSEVMEIYVRQNYSTTKAWFTAAIGHQVTVGDPDTTDNTDGITMEVTTQVWDATLGIYTLDIDAIYDGAFTNGDPDWARLDD